MVLWERLEEFHLINNGKAVRFGQPFLLMPAMTFGQVRTGVRQAECFFCMFEKKGCKMNIFKEMALSVYSYKSYKKFLGNKQFKVFGFGVVLMLIYWMITIGLPCMRFFLSGPGLMAELDEMVPEFELEDGILWVDQVIEYEEGGVYINIDTDPDSVFYDASEIRDFLSDYRQVILMDSEKMIMKDNRETNQFYFYEFGNIKFTKDNLLGFLPFLFLCAVLVLILMYFVMTALFFFGVIFVALLGMVAASCMNCRLTFGQLYMLGIYSRVLPLGIKALISFLPFHIPFFWILNFGLSLLILIFAMKNIREQNLPEVHGNMPGSGGYAYGSGYPGSYAEGNFSKNNGFGGNGTYGNPNNDQ